MTRTSKALSLKTLHSKKFKTVELTGIYKDVFGSPSLNGLWLIYGKEKNGKTTGALILAEYLSKFKKVLYISAEEGLELEFQQATKRANLDLKNRNLHFLEYETIEDLSERLRIRRSPEIIFLDNLTIYQDELKGARLNDLKSAFPHKLFVCIAHEERGRPYTSSAAMAQKLAKVIIRVVGMKMFVSGRVPGGEIMIDQTQAELYHGK